MGQKVNPHGARVGVILDWSTKWYAGKKDFSNNLVEDYNLRKMLKAKLESAGISHIDIQRTASKVTVTVYTAKPGIVIGKGGAGVEALKKEVEAFLGKPVGPVHPGGVPQLVGRCVHRPGGQMQIIL